MIPRPGKGELAFLTKSGWVLLPISALPDEPPIGSIAVPEHQLDEAVAQVLALLAKDEDGDE